MKREEILKVLTTLRDNCDVDTNNAWDRGSAIIAWLERLPAGCELVGFEPGGHLTASAVYDTELPRGNGFFRQVFRVNPDDLTKAGKPVCDGSCAGNDLGDCNHGQSNDGLGGKR